LLTGSGWYPKGLQSLPYGCKLSPSLVVFADDSENSIAFGSQLIGIIELQHKPNTADTMR
jgi:hypothetical protein